MTHAKTQKTAPTAAEQPDEPQAPRSEDLRGATTTARDRSAHRRHTWLYDDLLA